MGILCRISNGAFAGGVDVILLPDLADKLRF
jgi:hypothetical protein